MTTIVGNAMTHDLNRIRWKTAVDTFIIDLLPEVESEKSTNVSRNNRKKLKWNTFSVSLYAQ
jgi:hypothetical protein